MKKTILFLIILSSIQQIACAQSAKPGNSNFIFKSDSVHVVPDDAGLKTKLLPSMIVPAALIIYGVTTIGNHGLYSSRQARTEILKLTNGKGSKIDDYLQFSPYVEFAALLALKVKCKNDVLNTALLIAKSEIIMNAIVFPMKYITHEERPYSYAQGLKGVPLSVREKDAQAFVSLPSGHTANAFCAATIVYREFRYKSPWYGIGAYALATSVAAFRMINDQHWESDVLIGAGIGMLSTNIVYATHIHRWGRKEVCFIPATDGVYNGFVLNCKF